MGFITQHPIKVRAAEKRTCLRVIYTNEEPTRGVKGSTLKLLER
jgi:hypothetical protein